VWRNYITRCFQCLSSTSYIFFDLLQQVQKKVRARDPGPELLKNTTENAVMQKCRKDEKVKIWNVAMLVWESKVTMLFPKGTTRKNEIINYNLKQIAELKLKEY